MPRWASVVLLLLAVGLPALVHAQQPVILSGTVTDSVTGRGLGGVVVSVTPSESQGASQGAPLASTQTDDTGRFRLPIRSTGPYRVSFRRLGYTPVVLPGVVVSETTTVPPVRLAPTPQTLRAFNVVDSLSGIRGIVGVANSFTPVANAVVQVAGVRTRIATDSAGSFFVAIEKPGTYLVRVSHPQFGATSRSAIVERKSVIELAIMLDSTAASISRADWDDINQRQTWRRMTSATIDGGALARYGGSVLDALSLNKAFVQSGMRVGNSLCVFVNGVPKPGLPIDAIRIEDIAFIELFGATGEGTGNVKRKWPPGAPCGMRIGRQTRNGPELVHYALVWTK